MSAPFEDLWRFGGEQDADNPMALTSDSPQMQAFLDRGGVTRSVRDYSNETGAGRYMVDQVHYDPALGLPQIGPEGTGSFGNWMGVGPSRDWLRDPNMVYNDPNYGEITPYWNRKPDKFDWWTLVGPLIVSAVTGGAGLAAAGLELGAGAGAAGLANGASLASAGYAAPWYMNTGLSVAKMVGNNSLTPTGVASAFLPGLKEFNIPDFSLPSTSIPDTLQSDAFNYDPSLFGKMGSLGSMASVGSGDAARVATSVAPGAYDASYNSVVT